MMVGMAAGVVEMVPLAEQAEQMHEQPVQPFRAEHGAVTEFMHGDALQECSDGAVQEQAHSERDPGPPGECIAGERPSAGPQSDVSDSLESASQVTA